MVFDVGVGDGLGGGGKISITNKKNVMEQH